MNILTSLRNLFRPQHISSPEDKTWLRGLNAFEAGKKQSVARRDQEAVASFDTAFQCGRSDPELFALRGSCLQTLEWHLDAIDDFTRAISLQPQDCNHYFSRAMSKRSSGDLEGFRADVREAIRLAKLDNSITRLYDEGARDMGHRSTAAMYELQLLVSGDRPAFEAVRDAERAKVKGRRPKSNDRDSSS
jgi:tetratricopeptide (TPR) repeat protein